MFWTLKRGYLHCSSGWLLFILLLVFRWGFLLRYHHQHHHYHHHHYYNQQVIIKQSWVELSYCLWIWIPIKSQAQTLESPCFYCEFLLEFPLETSMNRLCTALSLEFILDYDFKVLQQRQYNWNELKIYLVLMLKRYFGEFRSEWKRMKVRKLFEELIDKAINIMAR